MEAVGSDESTNPSRRFKHRNVNTFLTYPHCNLEPEAVGLELWSLIAPWNPAYILVSRETHEDGDWHLHALAQSVKPVYTSNQRFFDISGFHPNIQSAKSSDKVREYILKNPVNTWEKGTFIPRKKTFLGASTEPKQPKPSKDDIVRDIIEHSTSKQEYLSMLQKALPYEWATKLQYFEYSANKLFPETHEIYTSPHPPSQPDLLNMTSIEDWLNTNLYQNSTATRKQSLYILGPTRTGKSSWARSLGRHNYWQNNVDWTSYDEEAVVNVIDDIPFKYCPCWKQLIGCQKDYIVNPKYGKRKKVASRSISTIVLANEDEDWLKDMTPAQQDYFYANCTVYIMEPGERFFGRPAVSATAHPSVEV
uniref:Replication-associated protein n=1 Tax=Sugarcane chlorotic streak virus TaxID=1919062 RepID=A0A1J0MU99_9GEMI|nr:Rep-associated protein [Sugarcane chlorotic streak virus]APD29096.1 Rep-associated protein [Sugarcane chlorotic streak virus]